MVRLYRNIDTGEWSLLYDPVVTAVAALMLVSGRLLYGSVDIVIALAALIQAAGHCTPTLTRVVRYACSLNLSSIVDSALCLCKHRET